MPFPSLLLEVTENNNDTDNEDFAHLRCTECELLGMC